MRYCIVKAALSRGLANELVACDHVVPFGEWGNRQPGRLWLFKSWFEPRLPSSRVILTGVGDMQGEVGRVHVVGGHRAHLGAECEGIAEREGIENRRRASVRSRNGQRASKYQRP